MTVPPGGIDPRPGADLGLEPLFLILQGANRWEVYTALPTTMPANISYLNAYLSVFYIFTSLHAAHVIGGMIPLIVVLIHAARRKYSANFHPGLALRHLLAFS